MISRRSFLAALSCLPFVGSVFRNRRLAGVSYPDATPFPNVYPPLYPTPGVLRFPEATAPLSIVESVEDDRVFVTCGNRGYEVFADGTYKEI